jgi:hypothetical protein
VNLVGQPYEIIPGTRGKQQGLRECGTQEALPRHLFHKCPHERLILLECAVHTTQEPLAEYHVCLNLTLLVGKAVVLDAEQGVKREQGLGKLVYVPDFVLGGGIVEVDGTIKVLVHFKEGGGGGGDVGGEEGGGDGDLELTKEEAVDVGGGDICGGKVAVWWRGDSEFWVGDEAELAHEVCHAHVLWWC